MNPTDDEDFLIFDEVRKMSVEEQHKIIHKATGRPVRFAKVPTYGLIPMDDVLATMGRFKSSADVS